MKFEIRAVKNGHVLKIEHDHADDAAEVLVHQENHDDEVECFADFLREINENYGPTTSRYSAKRIFIRVEPGDKYEDARSDRTLSGGRCENPAG